MLKESTTAIGKKTRRNAKEQSIVTVGFLRKQNSEIQKQRLCHLENVLCFLLPIPTISHQRVSFIRPRIANKLELPGFSYLLLGPSQNLAKFSMA